MKTKNNELAPLEGELKKAFLDKRLSELAHKCVLKQEGWGKRYIKGDRKGKKRKLYKLDERVLGDILKFLRPYIAKSVINSRKFYDEDLVAYIESEVWRVLREEGAKRFTSLVKLRILNSLTYKHNQNTSTKNRNINVTAVSYYTPVSFDGTEEVRLIDVIPDKDYGNTDHEIDMCLMSDKEKEVLEYLSHQDASQKARHQQHYRRYIMENKQLIASIARKL